MDISSHAFYSRPQCGPAGYIGANRETELFRGRAIAREVTGGRSGQSEAGRARQFYCDSDRGVASTEMRV